jgi:hypothetical protein
MMHYDLNQNEEMLLAIAKNNRAWPKQRFRAAVSVVRLWMLNGKIHEGNFSIYTWRPSAHSGDGKACGCIGHWAEVVARKRFVFSNGRGGPRWERERQLCFDGLLSKASVPNAIAAIEEYLRGR